MMKTNELVTRWPTFSPEQKKLIVLDAGHEILNQYKTNIEKIEFREYAVKDRKFWASLVNDGTNLCINEKPDDYRVWNNPFLLLHNLSHEIGHVYFRKIELFDDATYFLFANREYTDMEITCDIIGTSIMNHNFKLYKSRGKFYEEYLHHHLVAFVNGYEEEYDEYLSLLAASRMNTELGGIIKECKEQLIDPYLGPTRLKRIRPKKMEYKYNGPDILLEDLPF